VEFIHLVIDFILHIDVHLSELFNQYGLWIYGILFLIIFCETGLVVTPFLPGDSLLFAAGALVVGTALDVNVMAVVVITAAILEYCQLHDWPLLRKTIISQSQFKDFSSGLFKQSPCFLRETRWCGNYYDALCSHHSYLRTFCCGNEWNEIPQIYCIQCYRCTFVGWNLFVRRLFLWQHS